MNLKALTNAVRPAAPVIATQLQPEAFAVPEVIGQRSLTLGHDRRLQEMERSSALWPRQAYPCPFAFTAGQVKRQDPSVWLSHLQSAHIPLHAARIQLALFNPEHAQLGWPQHRHGSWQTAAAPQRQGAGASDPLHRPGMHGNAAPDRPALRPGRPWGWAWLTALSRQFKWQRQGRLGWFVEVMRDRRCPHFSRGLPRPAGAGEQAGAGAGAGGTPLSLGRWACQLLRQSRGEPPQRR